ncbi:MAG TPA: competence/damage-inducible protein A [Clostridiaceae bacterium]
MKAEIISVGTELLLGDIVNTNSQYISRRLMDLGISVYHQSVIGDNEERLMEEYKLSFSRSEMIITTGGLGPTNDDLTKEVAAKYFNKKLILHDEVINNIKEYFKKRNIDMNESNKKQALFPEGCEIIPNDNGTAPGCIISENNKTIILMPGPPKEMMPMFEKYIVPYLEKLTDGTIVSKVLRVSGIGESHMEEMVKDIIMEGDNPTIAPYAKDVEAILRITAKGKTKEECLSLIGPIEDRIREILKENIYATDETAIESVVGDMLIRNKLAIATAESCTGGLLAGRLINYPGISDVLKEGVITYSNEAKEKRLKVKHETLEAFGAVSSETAGEMARGIREVAEANIGMSTTGIAGPGGGSEEKPVGLVYIGLCINGNTITKRLLISGSRDKVRERSVFEALDFLRRELNKMGIY